MTPALSVFLLTWAGLALLKAPLALLSALVCGLLTFVPTIGPTVAIKANRARPVAVTAIDGQRADLPSCAAEPGSLPAHPPAAEKNGEPVADGGAHGPVEFGALLGLPGVLLALPLVVVLQVLMQKVVVQQLMDQWS